MNVTELKQSILDIVKPKSKHEINRVNYMYNGNIKYHNLFGRMKNLDSNDHRSISRFWHDYNIKQAELERFYKKQKHDMRTSKSTYVDYSDLAYNNSSDDL